MERQPAKSFQDLVVWRKSHALVLQIYRLTSGFPPHETYGLALQMRRAGVSIPANIAEGFKRRGRSDKARFMNIAEASLEEVRYYLMLVRDLGYANVESLSENAAEVARLLGAYSRALLARVS